jgi:hypothetical protein
MASAHTRLPLAAVALFLALGPDVALGSSFDPRTGKVQLEGAFIYGFDSLASLPQGATIGARDRQGNTVSPDTLAGDFKTQATIEGTGALSLGGNIARVGLFLPTALTGRRVDVHLWIQPRGTTADVQLYWLVGDNPGSSNSLIAGDATLRPTGRATSDGWLELATGPVDFAVGGAITPVLSINDATYPSDYLGNVLDPTARVLIDALDVVDLGPAAVDPTPCTRAAEAASCGELGVCLFGRCVDSAAAIGSLPQGQVRDVYLDRLVFEIGTIGGNRAVDGAIGAYQSALASVRSASSAKVFWSTIHNATELLHDAHATHPYPGFTSQPSLAVCLHLGDADQLPGGGPGLTRAPLVFSVAQDSPLAGKLEPGDVLVAIDGMTVAAWTRLAARDIGYNGDPAGREAVITPQLIQAAATSGSKLTFSRCPVSGQRCTDAQAQTVDVDTAPLIAGLWSGEVPVVFGLQDACDFRFLRQGGPATVNAYEFATWKDDGAVRVFEFNGFPDSSAPGWVDTMSSGMQAPANLLLFDERTGDGGGETDFICSGPVCDETCERAYMVPRFEGALDATLLGEFIECQHSSMAQGMGCGMFNPWGPTIWAADLGTMKDARVAMVTTMDVSENDLFTRFVHSRTTGATRIFGVGPTMGGFGSFLGLPAIMGEAYGGSCQMSDSVFAIGSQIEGSGPWASGTGVSPDEVVLQKQSDIALGVDTMMAAAKAWLLQ